jgi:HAD superfamily hydrolase (TIGR01549 family)
MTNTIIFDFDGTLADSMNLLLEITNELAGEFGYRTVTMEQITELQKLSSRDILKVSGISFWQVPLILRRFKLAFRKKASKVQLFPEVVQMLHSLKVGGYKLGIVSSNSVENIVAVLQHHQIDHLFTFISSGSIFGKGQAIKASLRANYIRPTEAMYVGDEIRDIDAARHSHIPSIAVTWGFNHRDTLSGHQPDYLVHRPADLLKLLDETLSLRPL